MFRVLIIEDSKIDQKVLKRFLEKSKRFEVLATADNGEAGIELISEFKDIDLILLDLNMPKMDGFEFLNFLSQKENPPQVLIISSSKNIHDTQKTSQYKNVIGHICKPLSTETILKEVVPLVEFNSAA